MIKTSFVRLMAVSVLFAASTLAVAHAQTSSNRAQATGPVAPSADYGARQALVAQYVTPDKYEGLYQKVLTQYTNFVPATDRAQTQNVVEDPTFQKLIFKQLRDRAVTTFTLPELQALAQFIESDEGRSISQKANISGMTLRNRDLSEQEKLALRSFSQTPEGQSISGKGLTFVSSSMSDVLKTLLIHRTMQTSAE